MVGANSKRTPSSTAWGRSLRPWRRRSRRSTNRSCDLGVPRCLHAIDATRFHQTSSWVVSFSILRPYDAPRRCKGLLARKGPRPATPCLSTMSKKVLGDWNCIWRRSNCWKRATKKIRRPATTTCDLGVLRCCGAFDATRGHRTMARVVLFSILSCFGPRRVRESAVASMASSRDSAAATPST